MIAPRVLKLRPAKITSDKNNENGHHLDSPVQILFAQNLVAQSNGMRRSPQIWSVNKFVIRTLGQSASQETDITTLSDIPVENMKMGTYHAGILSLIGRFSGQ